MGATVATLAAAVLALGAACGSSVSEAPQEGASEVVAYDTARVRIASGADTVALGVELALTNEQRLMGLMERPWLDPDRGMLFVYPEDQSGASGFWMFRTLIPLDIAYLAADGTILTILEMEPCESPRAAGCPSYPPGQPYRATLEVNRGYFTARGISVGDRVLMPAVTAVP